MSSKNKDIIIHDNQSSIFDIVEDTTTKTQSIQIKTKPPYHNEIFPNVKLVTLTDRCTLALKAECHSSTYSIDFVYHLSPTSFIVYTPDSLFPVHHVSNTDIPGNRDYMCKDHAKYKNIDIMTNGIDSKLEDAFSKNDFDAIFDILSKI